MGTGYRQSDTVQRWNRKMMRQTGPVDRAAAILPRGHPASRPRRKIVVIQSHEHLYSLHIPTFRNASFGLPTTAMVRNHGTGVDTYHPSIHHPLPIRHAAS